MCFKGNVDNKRESFMCLWWSLASSYLLMNEYLGEGMEILGLLKLISI